MKRITLSLIFALATLALAAQTGNWARTESIPFYSNYIGDTIDIGVHIPEGYYYSSPQASFPLIVLMDKQNAQTYAYNVHTIDFLSGVGGQLPDCIVVGIPFDNEERYYLTSLRKREGESLSGIEKTEKFLFEELIPYLEDNYPGIAYKVIAGHSRTGYLANYLTAKRTGEFDVALSLSGFYDDGGPVSQAFENFEFEGLPERKYPFKYYMAAGISREETTYKEDFDAMSARLEAMGPREGFYWRYLLNEHANHITNYSQALFLALSDAFSDYPRILNDWLHVKLDSVPADQALAAFQEDLASASYPATPDILSTYSIVSHYFNQQNYEVAAQFLNYGIGYLSKEPSLRLLLADTYKKMGNAAGMEQELAAYRDLIEKDELLDDAGREELEAWYEQIKP